MSLKRSPDAKTVAVVLQKLNQEHIPRMQRMLERVEKGEKLRANEINDLKRVYESSLKDVSLVERNPELTKLTSRYVDLFTSVIAKAMENEQS